MTVIEFNEGVYEEQVFVNAQPVVSSTFPELKITVAQILAAGILPEN